MDSKTPPKKYEELANFELCHSERTKLWAASVNSLVPAMFIVAFFMGLGLLAGAFLVHRVARRIKARIRGEQPPLEQD
jgi:hypothetical protein